VRESNKAVGEDPAHVSLTTAKLGDILLNKYNSNNNDTSDVNGSKAD